MSDSIESLFRTILEKKIVFLFSYKILNRKNKYHNLYNFLLINRIIIIFRYFKVISRKVTSCLQLRNKVMPFTGNGRKEIEVF